MNLLTFVQTFCGRTGLVQPSYAVSSPDTQVAQIVSLLNEVCEDITMRWDWQALVKEVLFTTSAGEDQGNFYTVMGLEKADFKKVMQQTIFNRTLRLPIFGPMTASKWQAIKALPTTGPFYKYRIRADRLLFNPPAPSGHQCAFEAATNLCVLAASGDPQPYFTADTDTFRLDDKLLMAGLRWKWKAEKGLDYAEEFNRYEALGADLAATDATKPTLMMDGGAQNFQPGIFVPSGNWNVS